jgi:hypothetical protein
MIADERKTLDIVATHAFVSFHMIVIGQPRSRPARPGTGWALDDEPTR